MDDMLCDELLQEIFTRLSASSASSSTSSSSSSSFSSSVCFVSKRWLHLYRTSKTSLSLNIFPHSTSTIPSLSSLLSHYPCLSSLSLRLAPDPSMITSTATTTPTTDFSDHLLFLISSLCSNLKHLSFLAGPPSLSSLLSLSTSSTLLASLTISLSRPLFFNWVACFYCLKELSVCVSDGVGVYGDQSDSGLLSDGESDAELGLESLSLSGVQRDDRGVGWLWRSCKNLKKLQLKSCGGIGDGGSFFSFTKCLQGLQEMELRACRSIVDVVLLKMAENCDSLHSLLIYDGGSSEDLLQFINNCRCILRKLDFRLPLDLNNDHLSALSVNFRGLSTLNLQSCCLVSGEGLKALGIALSSQLEELALINCDVVEKESGLLSTLGQNLRQLRKLDLSHNEFLLDKEFISMLISCDSLIELKLRGCKCLTGAAMLSLSKTCKSLQSIDIMQCFRIEAEAVELFILNSPRLKLVQIEEIKLTDAARKWVSQKFIKVVS